MLKTFQIISTDKLPVRVRVAILIFMACFVTYMLRTNFTICLVAMVEKKDALNYGPRYPWSKHDQSQMLGAYFWGYLFTPLLGGMMAEKFGGKNVIGISAILSALVTFLTPLFAQKNYWPIFAARFLTGFLAGVVYPALHNMISHWAPKEEKGKFISALLGGILGNIVTWGVLGNIIEKFGWQYGFYIPSFITLAFLGFWYWQVTDYPEEHPTISDKEKQLIQKSIGDGSKSEKQMAPIKSILTSIPFYALMILQYGNVWGLYSLQTAAPKFMTEALNFNLSHAGYLSSLPLLARLLCGFAFGFIGDYIAKRNFMSTTTTRKTFCLVSHILPGVLLFMISLVSFNPYLCVAVMTISLGLNGSSVITNLMNAQDLSPNFAGTIYGMINFFGTSSGFLSPIIVAYFTAEDSSIDQWQYIFWIGGLFYIIPALVFMVFGSGEIQTWNSLDSKVKVNDSEKIEKVQKSSHNTRF